MKKVCLEELADQFAITSANSIDSVDGLQAADSNGQKALTALGSSQVALLELGAMGDYLLQKGSELNKTGAVFANLAFESVLITAGMRPETVVDPEAISKNATQAVAKSMETVGVYKSKLVEEVRRNVELVLLHLAQREAFVAKAIGQMRNRIAELQVEAAKETGYAPDTSNLTSLWQGSEMLMVFGDGDYPYFEPSARTIAQTLTQFIKLHQTVFSSVIDNYINWVPSHAQNVLSYADGMNELVFDASAYFPMNTTQKEGTGTNAFVTYCSNVLPGMRSFTARVRDGKIVGQDVPQALSSISTKIDTSNWGRSSQLLNNLNRLESVAELGVRKLSREQVKARLQEALGVLDTLQSWVYATRRNSNQDVYNQLCDYILKQGENSIQARFVSELSTGLLWVINEAATNVPSYVLEVLENLLRYVEISMAVPQPE